MRRRHVAAALVVLLGLTFSLTDCGSDDSANPAGADAAIDDSTAAADAGASGDATELSDRTISDVFVEAVSSSDGTADGPVSHSVTLSWDASVSPGYTVLGYNVYRGLVSAGPYTQINPSIVVGTTYVDAAVSGCTTYYYVVTTVAVLADAGSDAAADAGTQESGYSFEVSAKVPCP